MMVVLRFFALMVVVSALQQFNALGGINDGPGGPQGVGEEILQPRSGNNHNGGGFDGLHLVHGQGVVVETGDIFRHQPGDGQVGALGQAAGELPHR